VTDEDAAVLVNVPVVPLIAPVNEPVVADRPDVSVNIPAPDRVAASVVPPYHLKPVLLAAVENHILLVSIPMA